MRKELLWARLVKQPEDAPPVFRPFLEDLPIEGEAAQPYILFSPADRFGRRKTNPKLLCLLSKRAVILEATRNGLITLELPYSAITSVEVGHVLLLAWFKITGVLDGDIITATFEYNTVAERFFRPAAELIRTSAACIEQTACDGPSDTEIFDTLIRQDYKYMNFSKMSLIPGEKALGYVYQPDIREKKGFLTQLLFRSHIAILTDHELILIQDEDNKSYREIRYGGVWRHFPLRQISGLTLTNNQNGKLNLVVEIAQSQPFVVDFSTDKHGELTELQDRFSSLVMAKAYAIG